MATTLYPYPEPNFPEFYDCEECDEPTDVDEWLCNFGICDECADEEYERLFLDDYEWYG